MSSQYTVTHRIPVWEFPDMPPYRDPFRQWVQSAHDPEESVTGESVGRAQEASCWERALMLWVMFCDLDSRDFDDELSRLIVERDIRTLRCLTKIIEADDRTRGLLKLDPES